MKFSAMLFLAGFAGPLAGAPGENTANASSTYNEVAPIDTPVGEMHFQSVIDLKQEPGVLPQLRNGEVARSAEWPASLFAKFQTARGASVCTAALVGPRTMLTAAHCVPSSGEVSFEYKGTRFVTDCSKHPDYANSTDVSADFALCLVRSTETSPEGVSLSPGDRFERVNTSAMDDLIPQAGQSREYITLTGYGCISDIVEDDDIDGQYRVGRTFFVDSSNSPKRARGDRLYAPEQRNNLITVDDTEYANLCPGDSGGPAFGFKQGRRVIIGVNSRVFYRDQDKTSYGASLVSGTGGPAFHPWAVKWMAAHPGVRVCGLGGSNQGCR